MLAQDGSWCSAGVVFLHDGDDIPGVSLVRENLKDLALWHQIGVSERPTVDLVVDWLQGLPRVRHSSLLMRSVYAVFWGATPRHLGTLPSLAQPC